MGNKRLKGVYFQIKAKIDSRQDDEQKGKKDGRDASVNQIHVLSGKEISDLVDKVLEKPFNDRFLGGMDYALAWCNDKISSEMTSIPKDGEGFRFFLFTKRRSDSPTQTKLENDGTIKIEPIQIGSGAFISETTLVILNVETGIVLELMNRNVGTTTSFAYYLSQCEGKPQPDFFEVIPVLRGDALRRLGTMAAIKSFEFSLSTEFLPSETKEDVGTLFAKVSDVTSDPATRHLNVVMSAKKGQTLQRNGIQSLVSILFTLRDRRKTGGKMRATGIGKDNRYEVVDFLNDDFLYLMQYPMPGRYINTGEVFQHMKDNFKSYLPELRESVGRSPVGP